MGSFTSVPLTRDDIQDLDFEIPAVTTRESLLSRCINELPKSTALISRDFIRLEDNAIIQSLQSHPSIRYNPASADGKMLVYFEIEKNYCEDLNISNRNIQNIRFSCRSFQHWGSFPCAYMEYSRSRYK